MFWRKKEKKELPVGIAPLNLLTNPKWTTDFNEQGGIREGYQGSTWVYACVKKRADSVSSVPLIVETKAGDKWTHLPNHPLQLLLNKPNSDFSQSDFLRMLVTHLDLIGNSLFLKNRSTGGRILELYPLMPQYATPIAGVDSFVKAFKYAMPNANQTQYAKEDVVHASYTNPDSFMWGQSPLMAAGKAVDIDNEGKAFQKMSFANRGVHDGAFTFDGDLSAEELNNLADSVKRHYQGNKNSRAPLLLNKMKYQSIASSPAEMDFMGSRQFTMKEIAVAYGVPSEMLTGMGDTNRASSETVRQTFWVDTISPLLSELESALNLQLVSDFGDTSKLRIKFDRSKVPALQQSMNEKLDIAQKLFAMGVPFNIINEKLDLGMKDMEGGDIGYIASSLMPTNLDFNEPLDDPQESAKNAYGL